MPAAHLIIYSEAEELANRLTHGIAALLSIVGLVVLVIFLFLGSVRAMLVPAVTVPVSLIATFLVLTIRRLDTLRSQG